MPDGAIIVKENYGKDKEKLMAITQMYLKKGCNPDAGDWFWAKYGPEGEVMSSGKVGEHSLWLRRAPEWLSRQAAAGLLYLLPIKPFRPSLRPITQIRRDNTAGHKIFQISS